MENKISIGEPFVNCYSKFAAITSIISVDDKAKIWGYLNYSTLMYMRSEVNDLFWMDLRSDENTIWKPEWKLCPYIDGEQIETEKIINNGTFTRFVINNKKMVTRQYLDTLRAVRTALSVSRYWL